MPKFDKKKRSSDDDDLSPKVSRSLAIPEQQFVEPRCHCCTSDFRAAIDKLIAQGVTSYSQIGKMFNIDRRSVSTHAKEHLMWEDAAIRQIVADAAEQAQQNAEEGIKGIATRRAFAEIYLQKTMGALMDGDLELSGKDALSFAQYLDKMDGQVEGAALSEMQVQFNAFMQAIREICPPGMWQEILDRTKEILGVQTPQLESPEVSDS